MPSEPTRDEVDHLPGCVLLEFGASWCPHCQAIQAVLRDCLRQYPHVRHIQIEDGPGLPLGRSFHVKLWPNLVLLRDGKIIRQMARPAADQIRAACADFGV